MAVVSFDPRYDDAARRRAVFSGEIVVHAARQPSADLVQLARQMLEEAFAPLPPETAQQHLAVADFAAILARLKPQFIHHPRCKTLIPAVLAELGCDSQRTYFDVPRLRSSTSHGYLTTGIAYAFHPHRDTWYSAPMCQINWWIPVYALAPDNGMEFHPRYFDRAIRNSSCTYDYQEWTRTSRFTAASQVGRDDRPQPHALKPLVDEPPLRVLPQPGDLMVFSGAQLHASVRNTSSVTRYSIDFRTVHLDDVETLGGARNVDSQCTGTTMGDYLRCTDFTHVPAAAAAAFERGPPQPALLNYEG